MSERKRIGIFIDYSLRIPSFGKSYTLFKTELFSDKILEHEIEIDGEEIDTNTSAARFYWKKELEDKDVEDFYFKKIFDGEDSELKGSDFKEYFYNTSHWEKFIEDYSFNLYGDAEAPFKKDIDLLNITQTHLFDVILIDEFYSTRKKSNTLYYLSKIRILPQAVLFLGKGQNINESTYFGIWNPQKNKEQENKENLGEFEIWLKDLEYQFKNL